MHQRSACDHVDRRRTRGEVDAYAWRRGRPRPANDSWIAAIALTHGLPVATSNVKDFEDYVEHEGLVLFSALPGDPALD